MNPILYIIMRSDMMSHTTGKKMAQASHASNAFVKMATDVKYDITEWQNETNQGFGTVYVLDGGNFEKIKEAVDPLISKNIIAGYVTDPTYPIIDGNVVHHIHIDTCAFVYADETNYKIVKNSLKSFSLHD